MAFTPGKHNDILDIAEELNTKTIQRWTDIIDDHDITSFKQAPYENIQEWNKEVINKIEESSMNFAYDRTKEFKTMQLFWELKSDRKRQK